jgi:hypothetical protein
MEQGKIIHYREETEKCAQSPTDPPQRPLLVYLQAVLPSLNATERRIAEYVLQEAEKVLSSSISEFRRGSGASVGSISLILS